MNNSSTTESIRLEGVHKSYGGRRVVNEISLTIPTGEFFGILGPNGAGKTTLMEMIEGLRIPDGGTINVLGFDPQKRDATLLEQIGVQTQAAAYFIRLTAMEHLITVASFFGCEMHQAQEALARVGLEEHGNVRVEKLSGGQRQRLAIASALVHNPRLIFLDEATASLDPEGRRELWGVLRDLKASGSTIMYTTHHLDEAEALCDRVAIMNKGQFLALGTPRELLTQSNLPSTLFIPAANAERAELEGLEAVESVTETAGGWSVLSQRPNEIMQHLSQTSRLDGVQSKTASLEDVYLELIGKENAA